MKNIIATGVITGVIVSATFLLGGSHKAPGSTTGVPDSTSEVSHEVGYNTKFSTEVNGVKMFNGKPVKFCFDHSKC